MLIDMKVQKRILRSLVLCSCLGLTTARAQDTAPNVSRFVDALEFSSKVLKGGDCEPEVSESSLDTENIRVRTQKLFFRGFCRIATTSGTSVEVKTLEAALQDLGAAAQRGLAANYRALASFAEGLGYCRLAKTYVPKEGDSHVHPVFCSARRASLAAFDDVNWSFVKYTNPEGLLKMPQLLREMRECYQNELAQGFDFACGITGTVPAVQEIVTNAIKEPVKRQLTGAASELGATISRKKSLSDQVMKRVDAALGDASDKTSLLGRASNAETRYNTLHSSVRELEDRATLLIDTYKGAVREGFRVLDLYARFEAGLLREGTVDHKLELEKGQNVFKEQVTTARREPNQDTPSTWTRALGMPTTVLGALAEGSQAKQALRGLCQIYFCEILNAGSLVKTKKVCASTARDMDKNPLCIEADGRYRRQGQIEVEGTVKSVASLCQGAGLSQSYIKVGMSPFSEAKACMADFTVPQ